MMEFIAAPFRMQLRPAQRVDSEDWVRVDVIVSTTGFSGSFDAELQLEDLRRFKAELEFMYAHVGQPLRATLSSAEPGVSLRLTSNSRGGVTGTYNLESERIEGIPTMLSGQIETDQAGLPSLVSSVGTLIDRLERGDEV